MKQARVLTDTEFKRLLAVVAQMKHGRKISLLRPILRRLPSRYDFFRESPMPLQEKRVSKALV